MTPELLLHKFGYLAVFVGTFLEGETILVMAGFFAERGYLEASARDPHGVQRRLHRPRLLVLARPAQGVKLLDRFPRMKHHFGKGIRLFERYGAPAIFITQWLYGLRITCAVIIGISKVSTIKFLIYEAMTLHRLGDHHRQPPATSSAAPSSASSAAPRTSRSTD